LLTAPAKIRTCRATAYGSCLGLVLDSGLEDATFYCFEREQDGEVAYSEQEPLWVGLLNGESRPEQRLTRGPMGSVSD